MLAALLHTISPELVLMLAVKDRTMMVCETSETMRLDCERIREAKAQTRCR
jgi:hypothetical protein